MKERVYCINDELIKLSVTSGKWYDLYDDDGGGSIIVRGNRGMPVRLDRKKFMTIQQLRDEKLKSIGI